VKRRSRKSPQRSRTSHRKPLGLLNIGKSHKRKSWTFERLEDRLVFSVAPVQTQAMQLQTVSYGNDTPQGQLQTWLDELEWNVLQNTAAANLPAPDYVLFSLPNDPLFQDQWNLLNTGQEVGNPDLQHLFGVPGEDINVVPAWNMGVTGAGVTVAVIDDGVQLTHPDLIANISPTLRFNAATGTSNVSPDLAAPDGGHGTSVAGIIGAVANNGIGISGIAPDVTIVPIKLDFTTNGITGDQFASAFNYALQHGVDITNNSYGPDHSTTRNTTPLTLAQAQILRDMAVFGRDGLGMINVFASGNNGGPNFNVGFDNQIGNYSSSSYNQWANSRYVITVTGVDHDGQYENADGTFTSYPEVGPNVLVAAPTGSNGLISIGSDNGYGSGIWTTDLVGSAGFNAAPLPSGFDKDTDPLPDPNYTSRFNGTSAAAPEVSAVVALMLQANPSLTYRDVEEILVRSARQNAEFETPSTGSLTGPRTTWQVNQIGPFRDPDPWNDPTLYPLPIQENPTQATHNPLADPGLENGFGILAPNSNDGDRQGNSRYESEPPQYTNGAGYTVSQGYGVYSEQVGYGHGTVDAGLAVEMAKQWTTLGQNLAPNTEKTFTTSVTDFGVGFNLPAAEKMADDNGAMLVPGGIGGLAGFIAYWNEFYKPVTVTNGVPDPTTGPFSEMKPPVDTRGQSYIDFNVPPPQQIDVEWAEVKLDIKGPASALNYLRIMLASPEGTQSDFNEYWADPSFSTPLSLQPISAPGNAGTFGWRVTPSGTINDGGGDFVWTFSTNRDWGETTNSAVVIDPVTGEPALGADGLPIFRNWELHLENWSSSALSINAVEVVWHGKPIDGGTLDPTYGSEGVSSAQRIQGFVGIDTNGDNDFNYNRYIQTVGDSDGDPTTTRLIDVTRQLDFTDNNNNGVYDAGDVINQEPFAANVVVDCYRTWDGVAEATPIARFLTGADGNYYFDVNVQGDLAQTTNVGAAHFGQKLGYQIRATDPLGRDQLDDIFTPNETTSNQAYTYLAHYKSVWNITPDWFFAPDRDNPLTPGNNPGEIFFDPTTGAPVPFTADGAIPKAPMAVKNINFLLRQDAPVNSFDVTGTVYSDLNGNGVFDGNDAPAAGVFTYWDKNRNGVFDPGETEVVTDANGQYTLHIDLTTLPITPTGNGTYQIGVIKPAADWKFTDTGMDGVETVFAGPGSPAQIVNFFLQPPANPFPPGGVGLGSIQGVVFNDLNHNGLRDPGEGGVSNFRVFIDSNGDGVWDSATEASTLTSSIGSFFFANVQPGTVQIDIVIPNEGTDAAAWSITTPSQGFRQVALGAGGSVTGVVFGLDNRADKDWGDLPDSYQTTAANNGPSHVVVPGFQLGPSIDGEVNGVPTPDASGEGQVGDNDDGVHIVSNGGVLVKGTNTLNVMVEGIGGLLTGWMDFNGDGHFDESERLQWSLNGVSLGGEADINPGTYNLQITIPANAVNGPIAARFRWGEQGLSFAGPAAIGEVEDYFFGLNYIYGDYNRDGTVNFSDFSVWSSQNGKSVTPYTGADGNGDGVVNQADYFVWKSHYGQSLPAPGAGALLALGAGSGSTLVDGGTGLGASAIAVGPRLPSLSTSVSSPVSSGGLQSATIASGSSSSSLLLMDLALGDIDSSSYHASSTDESLYSDGSHDDSHPNDMALAAVLADNSDLWNAF
jgi:subtilisin family serine protease